MYKHNSIFSSTELSPVDIRKIEMDLTLLCSYKQMSLEQFLENDTFLIAAAYELTKWSILVASNLHYTEKEQKYEELLQELDVLVEKYKVSNDALFDAQVSLDAESLEEEEMLERADKLMAQDASWN